MQKVNTTNSEARTSCLNEQRTKQVKWQSCLSFQKKTNTAIPNEPDFKKYDFKSYSDISEIAANVDDLTFLQHR